MYASIVALELPHGEAADITQVRNLILAAT